MLQNVYWLPLKPREEDGMNVSLFAIDELHEETLEIGSTQYNQWNV